MATADKSSAALTDRSSASCSACPAAGRSRSCASARARGSGWMNFGRPSTRAQVGRVQWRCERLALRGVRGGVGRANSAMTLWEVSAYVLR